MGGRNVYSNGTVDKYTGWITTYVIYFLDTVEATAGSFNKLKKKNW